MEPSGPPRTARERRATRASWPALPSNVILALLVFVALFGVALACARAFQMDEEAFFSVSARLAPATPTVLPSVTSWHAQSTFVRHSGPQHTPTPDPPRSLPSLRSKADQYTVRVGDALGQIASRYSVSLEQLVQANDIKNPDLLAVGQLLQIPAPTPLAPGPVFKIIPDSELVYGPAAVDFDCARFIQSFNGFLAHYQESINERPYTAAQVVEKVAQDFSVNPRLLLAILEYQSNWLTQTDPPKESLDYPLRVVDPSRKGLYRQLTWSANNLNRGFYLWRVNGTAGWLLADGATVPVHNTLNAGTAGVQQFFALLYGYAEWQKAVGPAGLAATYERLYGYPFEYAVEPLLPPDLKQPVLHLPFEAGVQWSFTGGAHAGWADGSAWAALDFAPPGEGVGCFQSNEWVTALADGLILRARDGAVMQDLDTDGKLADGFEGSGWTILYMHIESRHRIQPGTYVKAGERIGHPSCEGGVSTGTHVHLARRYNGEWLPADQETLPFVLDGWVSHGLGSEYDGYLELNGVKIEAYAGRISSNGIQR